MKRDVKTVDSWDFDRIIPCHGVRAHPSLARIECIYAACCSQDVIEKDGKAAWREAYKWYFD